MKAAFVVVAVIAFVGLLAYGLAQKAPNTSIGESLADGRLADAPPFEVDALEAGEPGKRLRALWRRAEADRRVALRELGGAPIVLNLWASWCAPCRQEADLLQETWREVRGEGVLFLGLNMQDARVDARGFLAEFGIDYPTVREPGRETARDYGATGVPETFFLTADGRVAGRHVGPIEAEELWAGIKAARTGRVLGAQEDVPTPKLRLVPVKPGDGKEPGPNEERDAP